jgi:prolyl-tRNA synthetase
MSELSTILESLKLYQYTEFKGSYIYNYPLIIWLDQIKKKYKSLFLDHDSILVSCFLPDKVMDLQKSLTGPNFHSEFFRLDSPRLLKPTSEFALYDTKFFKKNIKTYYALPCKYTLVNSVFRKESRSRPLIRQNQINYFIQSHIADKIDCETYLKEIIKRYKKIFRYFKIPFIVLKRLDNDKFQGAKITYAFETYFQNTGRTLQIGTIHNLSTNYSNLLNLKFKNKDNKFESIYQASYGLSGERLIASILIHNLDLVKKNIKLPNFLRLYELILFKLENIPKFKSKYHKIHKVYTNNNFIKTFNTLKSRDSIIFIIGLKELKSNQYFIKDRDLELYLDLNKIYKSNKIYKKSKSLEIKNIKLKDLKRFEFKTGLYKTQYKNYQILQDFLKDSDFKINGESLDGKYLYFSKTY